MGLQFTDGVELLGEDSVELFGGGCVAFCGVEGLERGEGFFDAGEGLGAYPVVPFLAGGVGHGVGFPSWGGL